MHYDEAIRWADRVSPGASLWGMLLAVGPLNESCAVRLLLGRVDEAAALAEEGLRRARQSGHLFSLGHALTTGVGRTMPLRREPERMLVHADEQIALTTEHGLFEWLNWGRLARGQALSDLGRLKEAVPEMESGLAAFRQSGGAPMLPFADALLALGYARLGRIDEAMTALNEVLTRVQRTGEKCYLAEILRLKGDVTLMGDGSATAQAERCFRQSLEVARAQAARWWELRSTVSLARLLRDTNRRDEACAILAEIYNWFTEGFDTADLKDAKALLEEL
jgi:predicted ATPase